MISLPVSERRTVIPFTPVPADSQAPRNTTEPDLPVEYAAQPGQARIIPFSRSAAASPRTEWAQRAGVSVIVVSDNEAMRKTVISLLDASPDAVVLASTDDPIQAVALAQGLSPEVAIVEIDDRHERLWVRTAHAIREANPHTGIVVIASDRETEYVEDKVSRGAGGWSYLLRDNASDARSLLRAVDGAAWGLVTIDPAVTGSGPAPVAGAPLNPPAEAGRSERGEVILFGLTMDEHHVLKMMALGYNDDAIANRMNLSGTALAETAESIYDKLRIEPDETVDRRVRAVMTYHLANRFA